MGPGRRTPLLGRAIGSLSLRSAARPRQTVAWILVATLVVGAGIFHLETDSDLLKILPKDHPHTLAAQNASAEFRGFYDFVTVFYKIDAGKCQAASDARLPYRVTPADCTNVTDEVYVRAMDEVTRFFMDRIPEAEYAIDLAALVKVVNWTNSAVADPASILEPLLGGDADGVGRPRDEAYAMPGTDPLGALQYEAAWQGANAADDSVQDVVARTFQAGRTLFFFDTSTGISRVELGRTFYQVVDAYAEAVRACDGGLQCILDWNVFSSDEGLAVRGVSTMDAYASDTAKRDLSLLAPFIALAIVLILLAAFRDVRVVVVAAANLTVAFLWTAGIMGWLGIPFSALNLTVVPLILGVGIDYGIHMVSEYLEHKGEGQSDAEAFREAGVRAGTAMTIATVTTVAGLMVMVFSPSVLMQQLAWVSSIALAVTLLFTVTFIPAVLTLMGSGLAGPRHRGSGLVPAIARAVHRHRVVAVVLVLTASGAAAWGLQHLEPEPFGNPELNYPPGTRVRDDSQTVSDLFFGGRTDTQSNYLIVEGDLTRPEAHRFLDELTRQLEEHPDLEAFNTASLTRVVRGWVAIERGTPGALVHQFLLGSLPFEEAQELTYPSTQEEIEAAFDAIFASPFANFMTILLAPEGYHMGMVSYDTHQDLTFEEVQRVWKATEEAIAAAHAATGHHDIRVHPFGNNAFSHLFIVEQQPWVAKVAWAAYLAVVGLIAVLTRSLRATLCTATVMGVTGLWWFGALPLMGIGLSVGLMLPIVFIMAIGSDDAVHLVWNMQQTRRHERVYRFVGLAVLLTTVTTFVAFTLFSFQTDLLVRRTLLATAAASVAMWAATMLIVPLFYPPTGRAEAPDALEPRQGQHP